MQQQDQCNYLLIGSILIYILKSNSNKIKAIIDDLGSVLIHVLECYGTSNKIKIKAIIWW